mmetsp:Transcript_128165/g.358798  ORF Transcript_128165/g.358798 Transcript_128165/m.358798 type:complete len:351 (+) Transcript_128165:1720-2772(+)
MRLAMRRPATSVAPALLVLLRGAPCRAPTGAIAPRRLGSAAAEAPRGATAPLPQWSVLREASAPTATRRSTAAAATHVISCAHRRTSWRSPHRLGPLQALACPTSRRTASAGATCRALTSGAPPAARGGSLWRWCALCRGHRPHRLSATDTATTSRRIGRRPRPTQCRCCRSRRTATASSTSCRPWPWAALSQWTAQSLTLRRPSWPTWRRCARLGGAGLPLQAAPMRAPRRWRSPSPRPRRRRLRRPRRPRRMARGPAPTPRGPGPPAEAAVWSDTAPTKRRPAPRWARHGRSWAASRRVGRPAPGAQAVSGRSPRGHAPAANDPLTTERRHAMPSCWTSFQAVRCTLT